ncbi:hypothetical protein [Streptomyces sp. MMG1121]|uniref:hypothetical protein n=1 Tax=Streptomyces sp. MMG1121 TaxID=1415544 RepID=UPI0006C20060|nr:hypothetical protein [Streptomyces sp. MMG1121]KOV63646.1 lipoprotein [Streptomyces sp. MMG1121]
MKRSSGVRLCATAAAGALSLALVAGCSDGGSKDSGSGGSKGSGTAPKALSAAELTKLVLAEGEVPGYTVEPVKGVALLARSAVTATDKRCEPLMHVLTGQAPVDAAAETARSVDENRKVPSDDATSLDDMADGKFSEQLNKSLDRSATKLNLSSYAGDGAEKALKSVSDAVRACAGGFTGEQASLKATFPKVAEERSAGTGDASVAFVVTGDSDDGDPVPVHAEVVRHGNVLASYYTLNIGAVMAKKAYAVPSAVVKAQAAKLK